MSKVFQKMLWFLVKTSENIFSLQPKQFWQCLEVVKKTINIIHLNQKYPMIIIIIIIIIMFISLKLTLLWMRKIRKMRKMVPMNALVINGSQ